MTKRPGEAESPKSENGKNQEAPEVKTVEFAGLAGEASHVLIKEGDAVYILRRTATGRLVLNK